VLADPWLGFGRRGKGVSMKTGHFGPLVLLLGVIAVSGVAAEPAAPIKGYLAPGTAPDTLRILPPPPAPNSLNDQADQGVFAATRSLAGQPRWALAIDDADLGHGAGYFACAMGVKLDAANAPTLNTLLRRMSMDSRGVIDPPKDHYARPRPYLVAKGDATICVPKSEGLSKSPSYPSGHSTLSWAWGLILAELEPDHATAILGRARSIGESRVVCGVHNPSDIDQGRTNGSILVAALHGDAAFRADLEKARAEVGAARQAPHAGPGECAVQDAAAAHTPY
jgi:acid phosphatase (class A)